MLQVWRMARWSAMEGQLLTCVFPVCTRHLWCLMAVGSWHRLWVGLVACPGRGVSRTGRAVVGAEVCSAVVWCMVWCGWVLGSGGLGAGGGIVAGDRANPWCRSSGMVSRQCWVITGCIWRESVGSLGWWPVGLEIVVVRCRACCCWRASGIQRATWAGVLLCISRSIRERLISGVGVAGVGGVGSRVSESGNECGGLGWVGVVVGCCIGGGSFVTGRRDGSGLSVVVVLAFGVSVTV